MGACQDCDRCTASSVSKLGRAIVAVGTVGVSEVGIAVADAFKRNCPTCDHPLGLHHGARVHLMNPPPTTVAVAAAPNVQPVHVVVPQVGVYPAPPPSSPYGVQQPQYPPQMMGPPISHQGWAPHQPPPGSNYGVPPYPAQPHYQQHHHAQAHQPYYVPGQPPHAPGASQRQQPGSVAKWLLIGCAVIVGLCVLLAFASVLGLR